MQTGDQTQPELLRRCHGCCRYSAVHTHMLTLTQAGSHTPTLPEAFVSLHRQSHQHHVDLAAESNASISHGVSYILTRTHSKACLATCGNHTPAPVCCWTTLSATSCVQNKWAGPPCWSGRWFVRPVRRFPLRQRLIITCPPCLNSRG